MGFALIARDAPALPFSKSRKINGLVDILDGSDS
jgi:hypothetical protein